MTTANKHAQRSHRSYRDTKATLGSVERSNYRKNASKVSATKRIPLLEKLANIFGIKKGE